MYQLWAKKRNNANYEMIIEFENRNKMYSLVDELDTSIYQEAIIINANGCELYVEFEKPFTMKMRKNNEN